MTAKNGAIREEAPFHLRGSASSPAARSSKLSAVRFDPERVHQLPSSQTTDSTATTPSAQWKTTMRANQYTAAPHERKSAMTPALAIHREQTLDFDGLPWPPLGEGWHLGAALAVARGGARSS